MNFGETFDIVAAAGRRWAMRTAGREAKKKQTTIEAEPSERVQARLDRLQEAARSGTFLGVPSDATPPNPAVLRELGLERTFGQSDFQNIAFLELALAVSRFVGRVNIRSSSSRTLGFGTGSMVSPRLLLTNNHVLKDAETARFSQVEFDYQVDRDGRALQAYPFALQPDLFFLTDPKLDFTLVAVAKRSTLDRELHHYGWSRLIESPGKILLKEHVNIIQHPRGEYKKFVTRDNEVVDILDDYLHYVTDTEPGSSGSPVYNDQWEVVALHHAGVPRMIDGKLADKRGGVWDGSNPENIAWAANEGIRTSRLVQAIKAAPLDGEKARMREDLLNLDPPHPLEAAKQADEAAAHSTGGGTVASNDGSIVGHSHAQTAVPGPPAGAVTFTVPLRITVELINQQAEPGATLASPPPSSPATPLQSVSNLVSSNGSQPAELSAALAELSRASTRPYYDAVADARALDVYYRGIDVDGIAPAKFYRALSDLVIRTHHTKLLYSPATQVYPWVDLRPGSPPTIKSVYSGKGFDPRELIEADFRVDKQRSNALNARAGAASGLSREGAEAALEAQLPYNCEHVVPQSWFDKREPMRGDLHHLFACESGCNSFRGNSPYFDFPDFEEPLRSNCGKREAIGFEPTFGKGTVARATLYFLLRYPGLVGNKPGELRPERIATLLAWHKSQPVDEYERHRNAAIADKQGNRNPLIDFPEWAERIAFALGFAGAEAALVEVDRDLTHDLQSAVAAIGALDLHGEFGAEAAVADPVEFGHYLPAQPQVVLLDDGRKLKLMVDFTYIQQDDESWPVPAGWIVDGASIPRVFWTLIGGPLEGRCRNASIIHDHFCDTHARPWRDTHRMFYEAMRRSGMGEAKAKLMYYAIYRFGPRWTTGEEALGIDEAVRAPTDRDAPTLLADAEAIYAHGLDLDEIDNLADARDRSTTESESFAEAATDSAPLDRARRLCITGGDGNAADLEAVTHEAALLPAFVLQRFERKKIRIVACRESVTDFERDLRGVVPRGWENTGRTWDDVPGTYLDARKRVVIATIGDDQVRAVPTRESGRHGSANLTVHESLHGFDYSGNHAVLGQRAFADARQADLDRLDLYERQPGQAGLEETFAESGARFVVEPGKMQSDWPNLFGFWQSFAAGTTEVFEAEGSPEAGDETYSFDHAAAESDRQAPIGIVSRDESGAVHLDLRAEGPGGTVGHASFPIPVDHEGFATLEGYLDQNGQQIASVTREALIYGPGNQ